MTQTEDCGGPWIYASACQQPGVLKLPFMCQVCRAWGALDRFLSQHMDHDKHTRASTDQLSGGMFLYEKQAARAMLLVHSILRRHGSATVCETGFNAGHSALLFLTLPNTTVVTFDTFEQSYQRAALDYMRRELGLSSRLSSRLHAVAGDTLRTVPGFAAANPHIRCDLSHPSVPRREHHDILSLYAMSRAQALVMPTALGSNSVVYGSGGSWKAALRDGLIWRSQCGAAMEARTVHSQYRFAQALGNVTVHHIFCWARFASVPPLHSGLVMNEFGHRVLARSIAQSAVVLVGRPQPKQMLARLAMTEGHTVVSVAGSSALRQVLQAKEGALDWVLLLFIDTGGAELVTLASTLQVLRHSTITYIVMRFAPFAVRRLLEQYYTVRILSCTHHLPDFGPNTLLTRSNVDRFGSSLTKDTGYAYVFATQGLDLAIPSRRLWQEHKCYNSQSRWWVVQPSLDWFMNSTKVASLAANCVDDTSNLAKAVKKHGRALQVHRQATCTPTSLETWFSHADPTRAEAVCRKLTCCGAPHIVCKTRVLVPRLLQAASVAPFWLHHPPDAEESARRPNLLLLLIDPISRASFARSLPRLSKLLPALAYDTFTRYTAVGNNSGANQAALYQGRPLLTRRLAMKNSSWLWDELRHQGYATFKGEVRNASISLHGYS